MMANDTKTAASSTLPLPWEEEEEAVTNTDNTGMTVNDTEAVFSVAGKGLLVIAVPHGGNLLPPEIPDRLIVSSSSSSSCDGNNICIEPDTNTAQLGMAIIKSIIRGRRRNRRGSSTKGCCISISDPPSIVIGKLHRCKVDLARARESSCDSSQGRMAWDEYHTTIQQFLDQAIARHGRAHLIDLHGQSHRMGTTEIGHMFTNTELRNTTTTSSSSMLNPERSSIASMMNLLRVKSMDDVVRGPYSIGTLLTTAGFAAVPSLQNPHPCCLKDCEFCCGDCCCCLIGRDDDDEVVMKNGVLAAAAASEDATTTTTTATATASTSTREQSCCGCCRPCTAFDAPKSCPASSDCSGFGPCSFFWGANTLAMYGGGRRNAEGEPSQLSKYRGVVAATQLETPWIGARQTKQDIAKYGPALSGAIMNFMDHFYCNLKGRDKE